MKHRRSCSASPQPHVKSVLVLSPTCVDDGGPRLDIDAGCSLSGPEDPHQRLSGEDAGCFAYLQQRTNASEEPTNVTSFVWLFKKKKETTSTEMVLLNKAYTLLISKNKLIFFITLPLGKSGHGVNSSYFVEYWMTTITQLRFHHDDRLGR